MPLKMRLQRRGKKGNAFYHIVIADGRAPRDGKFIEKIGTYDPITVPADIQLDRNKALDWLNNGAQPTDTVRAILSYTGVLYKNHLLKGVTKGALTEEQAEAKFQDWLKEKTEKILNKKSNKELELKNANKKRIESEIKVNEAREAAITKKKAAEMEEKVRELKTEAASGETQSEEVETRDAIPVPADAAPAKETDVQEAKTTSEEAVAEELIAEEPVAEEAVAEEAVAEEAKAEEPVKEDKAEDTPEDIKAE